MRCRRLDIRHFGLLSETDYDLEGMIRSLYAIDKLEWEIAAPGHAEMGGKAEAQLLRRYLEALREGVIAGIVAQHAIEQIVPTLRDELAAVP